MNVFEIGALTIGLGIVFVLGVLSWTSGSFKSFNSFSNSKQFMLQKWLYISFILLTNVGLCVMVYYTQNLQVLLYVIVVLKLKDILSAFIFVFGMLYKNVLKLTQTSSSEIQMENMASDDFDKILAFVPAYKELEFQVSKTLNSLVENTIHQNYMMLCLVSDGFTNYTNLLESVLLEKSYYYNSWKGEENIGVKVHFGKYNGKDTIILTKIKNLGKKDSIVLCNDLFNYTRTNLDSFTMTFREELNKDLQNVFNVSNKFDYIFTTDADTRLNSNVIQNLLRSIKERNAIAGCGVVNVEEEVGSNFYWDNLQNFQYLYGQYLRRSNEDLMSQVLCLPGCISMFKILPETNGSLETFSKLPNVDNLFESSVQFIGTDRRFTGSLVYNNQSNQSNSIIMDSNTHAYTSPPQTWKSFINQRKRWCNNMYFNNMYNIVGKNVNILSRFFNVIEFLRMSFVYFRVFNSIYFIFLLANSSSYNILELIPLIVLVSFPIVCFFVYSLLNSHLRSKYLNLVLGFLLNKISTFFINPVIFTSMLWNIGNTKW